MASQAQRLADLEARVADLADELKRYHDQACVIRALEDVIGHPMTSASYAAQQQPRRLHAVPDLEREPEIEAGA